MNLIMIVFIILSIFVAVVCFLTTNSFVFSALTLIIFIAYYFLIANKRIKKYIGLITRINSCYFFINSFVISLSVKESIEEAYLSGLRIQDKSLHSFSDELNGLADYEKIKYLKNYFNLAIYSMFINVLNIYQDQGGNILLMSENLMRESTRVEKTLTESRHIGSKYLIEFVLLWVLSFGILLFMKFGVQDFYNKMLQNQIFAPLIFVFFLICLLSIHLFINCYLNVSVKEDIVE